MRVAVPSHTQGSSYLMGVSMRGKRQKRFCRSQFPSRSSGSSSHGRRWYGRGSAGGGGSWLQPSLQDAPEGGFEEDPVRGAAVPALRAGPHAVHCLPDGWQPPRPQLLRWPGKRLTLTSVLPPCVEESSASRVSAVRFVWVFYWLCRVSLNMTNSL